MHRKSTRLQQKVRAAREKPEKGIWKKEEGIRVWPEEALKPVEPVEKEEEGQTDTFFLLVLVRSPLLFLLQVISTLPRILFIYTLKVHEGPAKS